MGLTVPLLCERTKAIYKPGVVQQGVKCQYAWSGKMPNTGRYECVLCGKPKNPDSYRGD